MLEINHKSTIHINGSIFYCCCAAFSENDITLCVVYTIYELQTETQKVRKKAGKGGIGHAVESNYATTTFEPNGCNLMFRLPHKVGYCSKDYVCCYFLCWWIHIILIVSFFSRHRTQKNSICYVIMWQMNTTRYKVNITCCCFYLMLK